jgi:F420-dependent oxidoreductase-like protein
MTRSAINVRTCPSRSAGGLHAVAVTALASHGMRLGFYMGYAQPGTNPRDLIELAREAERIGFESAWAAEAWGTDAVTPLAWLGALTTTLQLGTAIMQLPGRSPANTAMTAATLDMLSGGRFLLGLGTSGPQVVEGWHGQEWGKPLVKTREYVSVVRAALRRERLEHHGEHYDIPVRGGTGLGKPLRLMARPLRDEIPIYLAAISPKAVEQAFVIADGWLPIFWSPERARSVFPLDRARDGFDIAPSVPALLTDDVETGRNALKEYYAFYVGGMGARGKNFYNDLFARYGYEEEAREIQELFLDGRQREAAAKVPDAFVDEVALIGSVERMRDRLAAWRESGATSMLVSTRDSATLRAVAEAAS